MEIILPKHSNSEIPILIDEGKRVKESQIGVFARV